MKKSNLFFLFVAALIVACKPVAESSFKISPISLNMQVGDIETIDVGSARNVVWTSSDEDVATVYNGVVEALAVGKAIITATSGDQTANCVVFVSGSNGASLRISPLTLSLEKGETFQMHSHNTFDMPETWTSSNTDVVIVNDSGLVTAVAPGIAEIVLSTDAETVRAIVDVKFHWGEYKLVWSDEFNGTSLDLNIWNIETGGGGWGNNELQFYTDRSENLRVEDGNLVIEARKEKYEYREYTSARMQSRGKKEFLYGKVEARIKFPGGGGTWPAFWMMGNSGGWPSCGEIDIQEHVGNITKRASSAVHTPNKNGSKGNNWSATRMFDFDLAADYHIYGCEWAQGEKNGQDVIRFYVDDVQYGEIWGSEIDGNKAWPFTKPHYLIFNCAIGGNMGGNVDDSIFEVERKMLVDWVRVYQREQIQ